MTNKKPGNKVAGLNILTMTLPSVKLTPPHAFGDDGGAKYICEFFKICI